MQRRGQSVASRKPDSARTRSVVALSHAARRPSVAAIERARSMTSQTASRVAHTISVIYGCAIGIVYAAWLLTWHATGVPPRYGQPKSWQSTVLADHRWFYSATSPALAILSFLVPFFALGTFALLVRAIMRKEPLKGVYWKMPAPFILTVVILGLFLWDPLGALFWYLGTTGVSAVVSSFLGESGEKWRAPSCRTVTVRMRRIDPAEAGRGARQRRRGPLGGDQRIRPQDSIDGQAYTLASDSKDEWFLARELNASPVIVAMYAPERVRKVALLSATAEVRMRRERAKSHPSVAETMTQNARSIERSRGRGVAAKNCKLLAQHQVFGEQDRPRTQHCEQRTDAR
jgi:hypothetical protein